ncbi:EamA family transporter RarD [Oceanobacillus halotolerans]|uniref:EamA family transporter RarD n=1 Tax=Oceanobacillus halotolerans TaxID=2663380 RepID=UPI0013DD789A|nr:EamA family transporter RarD [Oceanobacillus halotolerans]
MGDTQQKAGILYALGAYLLWGFLPAYWKLVDYVPAGEILAHRIIWSFVFMIGVVVALRKWPGFIQECKVIAKDKKKLIGITVASFVISLNWLSYIWAVNSDHVIQASLGYYINPLVSILLGMIVLKEKLSKRQLISFVLAGIGVINLTVSYGVFPWVSLALAFTFAIYGLLKKMVDVSAMFGLTIETMIITPIALLYVVALPTTTITTGSFFSTTGIILFGAGVVTAIPLLLFASGAKKIPLSMVGFLQYIAPTIMLVLGIFAYGETFSQAHLISFMLIWIALLIYMSSSYHNPKRRQVKAS